LTRNDDKPFVWTTAGTGATGRGLCTGLHNLDRAPTSGTDLVDFASTLPDDATNEVVGDVDLLRLLGETGIRGRDMVRVWRLRRMTVRSR